MIQGNFSIMIWSKRCSKIDGKRLEDLVTFGFVSALLCSEYVSTSAFVPFATFLLFFTLMIINIDRKIIKTSQKSRVVEIENVHINVTFRDSEEEILQVKIID